MRQTTLVLLILLYTLCSISGQQKFDCDGSAYITLVNENQETSLIELNVGDQEVGQTTVFTGFGDNINAIGFNRRDSLIYGINPEVHQLFRIGSDGVVEVVKFLPLEGNYFAGDISPQSNELVLLNRDSIALVNLDDSEMPVSYVPITVTDDSFGVFATDIAFHPITQVLYGYDAVQGKLITIDPTTGLVDNSTFPPQNFNSGLPAMFFDARGELYGIGTNSAVKESTLFRFNLDSGNTTRSGFEGEFGDRDGCSCPFTLKVFQKQTNTFLTPCASMELIITVANLSGQEYSNYSLSETLPEGYLIEEISRNPYASVVSSGAGTNTFSLTSMDIPIGIDSIILLVQIPENAAGEVNEIQATLNGQNPTSLIDQLILSDDLTTGAKNEPTMVLVNEVSDVVEAFVPSFIELCQGDTFQLALPIIPNIQFTWQDSFEFQERDFTESGDFVLITTTACETYETELMIRNTEFSVNLGEDIDVNLGDIVLLDANPESFTPIVDYKWSTEDGEIPCDQCISIQVNPSADAKYLLIATNESGCITNDEINIFVTRDVFAPNIFSPNGDGINDYFYLQTGFPQANIVELNIYNRWGAQVFGALDIMTSDELKGWDGSINGQTGHAGTYIWTAKVQLNGGRLNQMTGQIILSR